MPAFATVSDLATYLQRDLDAADTATATQALDTASGAIRSYTRQTLSAATTTDQLRANWSSEIVLPERPVSAVASVVVAGPYWSQTLTSTDYRWTRQGSLYVSPLAGSPADGRGSWGGPEATVTVTYTHGFAVIPDDIRGICLAMATRSMAVPVSAGVASESIGSYSVSFDIAAASTPTEAEHRTLRLYRR